MTKNPNNLRLFEVYYSDQSSTKSSFFTLFDVRANPEFLKREIAHFLRFHEQEIHLENCYYGLLSPKFMSKSNIPSEQWLVDEIQKHSMADIILINPKILQVYLHQNCWMQAEYSHPGVIDITQNLFDLAGFDYKIHDFHRHGADIQVYCNYWVANKSFWDEFIAFIKKLESTISNMPKIEQSKFFVRTHYKFEAVFFPFIFERMITTFLETHRHFKVAHIDLTDCLIASNKLKKREVYFLKHFKPRIDKWESKQRSELELIQLNKLIRRFLGFPIIETKPPFKTGKKIFNSISKRIFGLTSTKKLENFLANDY